MCNAHTALSWERMWTTVKKNTLLRTNIMVCSIIIIGFLVTAVISYHSNWGVFERNVEQVSDLTIESVSHQIDSLFAKPVNVSLTMANDSLLKDFLTGEEEHLDDEAFVGIMREYLNTYREKYSYDSIFLVSARTGRYYHFNGLDRILTPGDPENGWYYSFLETGEEYSLNIDNDQAASNEITVFVNARILDQDGGTMGIVGVGFQVESLQELLRGYEDGFDLRAYLVDSQGMVEISTDQTGYAPTDLFAQCSYPQLKEQILSETEAEQAFWYDSRQGGGYLVSSYIPNLGWFLLIDHDVTAMKQQFTFQLLGSVTVIGLVILAVLMTITRIIHRYNQQVIQLTIAREQEHKTIFQTVAEQSYDDIYEIDVSHDRAASEATLQFFERIGVPEGAAYKTALRMIAERQVKEEFRQGYLDIFSPEAVLRAFAEGRESLRYEFLHSDDGAHYYWQRIIAHLFKWKDDNSVRMLVYHQNIAEEKKRELIMLDKMQRDSLTGLYNKAATQEHIRARLEDSAGRFAFFILDIDNFKQINDRFGHAAGDKVLVRFAAAIRQQFGNDSVVGRIGGDEFAAFMPVADRQAVEKMAEELVLVLCIAVDTDRGICRVSTSIGVAMTPEAGHSFESLYKNADSALYQTKKKGKNGYSFYRK